MKRAVDMRKHGVDYTRHFLTHYKFGSQTSPDPDEFLEEAANTGISYTDIMNAQTKNFGWLSIGLEHENRP